jgi:hypothetical protein
MDDLFKKIDNIVATVSDHISPETMMALMVIVVGVLLILLLLSRTRGPSKREVKSMTTLLARVEQLEVSLGMLRSEVKEAVDRFKDIAADVRDDVMPRPKRGPGEGSGGSQGSTGGTGGGSRGGGILGAASAEASPGSLAQGLLKTRSSFLDRITGLFKRAPRFEASMLDGATQLKRFVQITVPMIRASIVVVLTTITIGTLKVFDIVRTMTGGNFSTNVIANEMYSQTFRSLNYGTGSALAIILFLGVVPIIWYNIRQLRLARTER